MGLLFLILSLSLFSQTFDERSGYEEADAESNRQIINSDRMESKENTQIENKEDGANKNTPKESEEQNTQIASENASETDDSSFNDETPMTADEKPSDITKEENRESVELKDAEFDKEKELKCTLSVSCATIFDNLDRFNQEKIDILPEGGIIFLPQEVIFQEGDSVLEVLTREMKNSKIHMEYSMTPLYNTDYIEGIGNIYEFDCGELSGWIYKVNGASSNYGSSNYRLNDGDVVEWLYTCDLGKDLNIEYIN